MELVVDSKISSGAYGTILKVLNKTGKEKFALKVVPNKGGNIQNLLEIILYLTPCKYLLKCIDYKINKSHYEILMPMAEGSLHKKLNSKFNIKKLLYEIALGISFLHRHSIVHGDIKPSNILYFKEKDQYTAKIIDFSLSALILTPESRINRKAYTEGFKPPEICVFESYTFASDIWALGRTFKSINFTDNSKEFVNLIDGMTKFDECERFNIHQILQSSYFENIRNDFKYEVQNEPRINIKKLMEILHMSEGKSISKIIKNMSRVRIPENIEYSEKEYLTIIDFFCQNVFMF